MFALNHSIAYGLLLSLLAGLATTIGSLIVFLIKKPSFRILSLGLGFSAGVMIFISFAELLTTSIKQIGIVSANIAFFIGIIMVFLIDVIIPHEYIAELLPSSEKESFKPLTKTGILVALGIAIHNLAEGIAVLAGSLHSIGLGIVMAVAIAIHNIPEGISVSLPIFYATKSKRKAFWLSFLSGISEPIGALLAVIFLWPFFTPYIVHGLLAFVAGIMIYISFDELLPAAHKYGEEHIVAVGIILGMIVMSATLILLR